MGFPPNVKTQALVAAARHCCVCHRYKGLKIEVHHIEQESQGGANTFENAIPLCLDCHTDAGHYNVNHPKGTKFSKAELIRARNEWYAIVQLHKISAPVSTGQIHTRYLVCRRTDITERIIQRDLGDIPEQHITLVQNEILQYFRALLPVLKEYRRTVHSWDKPYLDVHAYRAAYPDAQAVDSSDYANPYYETVRIPTRQELDSIQGELGAYVNYLLRNGTEPEQFLKVVAYPEFCGGGDEGGVYYQQLVMKPLWAVFLNVKNTSDAPIRFNTLAGKFSGDTRRVISFQDANQTAQDYTFQFPAVSIEAGNSILIPLFFALAPFGNLDEDLTLVSEVRESDYIKQFNLSTLLSGQSDFLIQGPYVLPEKISYAQDVFNLDSEIHAIDLSRTYILDEEWLVGSCPHLFYKYADGRLKYIAELFSRFPNTLSTEHFVIDDGVGKIIIAELEDEVTFIQSIHLNGILTVTERSLSCGDTLELEVQPGDRVIILGRYISQHKKMPEAHEIRNRLIGRFMRASQQRFYVS